MSIVPDRPEQQEREHLYTDGARRYKHLPNLALQWLEELVEQGGLPNVSADQLLDHEGKPLLRPVLEDPVNTPQDPDTYHARLANGQVVWVKLDEQRSSLGHRAVSIVEKANMIKAILAALTILEASPTDIKALRDAVPFLNPSHPSGIYETLGKLVDRGDTEAVLDLLNNLNNLSGEGDDNHSVEYAVALLRYFRPDYENLPLQEQRDLLVKGCERINKLLEAARHLNEFLEYGSPDKDQRPALENPRRDVEAAALRDVEGYTYREIAGFLDVEISEKSRCVGDYSTVARMVERGREVLRRAFGEDGWREKAAGLRSRLERHKSLTPPEQFIADCADDWGVPFEFASKVIVDGLDPNCEQAQSMARSGATVVGARNLYDHVYWRSAPPHPRLVRSEEGRGWWDVICPNIP